MLLESLLKLLDWIWKEEVWESLFVPKFYFKSHMMTGGNTLGLTQACIYKENDHITQTYLKLVRLHRSWKMFPTAKLSVHQSSWRFFILCFCLTPTQVHTHVSKLPLHLGSPQRTRSLKIHDPFPSIFFLTNGCQNRRLTS